MSDAVGVRESVTQGRIGSNEGDIRESSKGVKEGRC